jgi:hypothetical protein
MLGCNYMRRIFAVLLALVAAVPAFSWSAPGHRVVAMIAERRLTPKALAEVRSLLGDESLNDAAVWADNIRSDRHEAYGWHFMNIPIEASDPDPMKYCPATGCVISKIEEFTATLRSTQGKTSERTEALKFLIHFIGDLHQPLHVGDHGDRGGNDLQLEFFGVGTNLHSVWDRGLPSRLGTDEAALAAELGAAAQERWASGTVKEWALESLSISRKIAYKNLSNSLGQEYFDQCAPSVRVQLAKAGVRLAQTLNRIWE